VTSRRRPRQSTVPPGSRRRVVRKPPTAPKIATPPKRPFVPQPHLNLRRNRPPAKRQIAGVVDDEESTLLDVLDNLLDKGVVLNAEVILALANVDLIYLRLSAILCGAARVMPRASR
jgi:hypothetical protein